MRTTAACHMIATAILFNVGAAAGTRFGMLRHPSLIAGVVSVVFGVLFARHVSMPLVLAAEAICKVALLVGADLHVEHHSTISHQANVCIGNKAARQSLVLS
jgi:hypothetical protein